MSLGVVVKLKGFAKIKGEGYVLRGMGEVMT